MAEMLTFCRQSDLVTIVLVFAFLFSSGHSRELKLLPKVETQDVDGLLLVQVVHRHGEREALFDIPVAGSSQNARMAFPKEAQLTPEGVRQMYEYGLFIRQRYREFFDDGQQASSQRIRVISSATDRTINSAQALTQGLLSPPNGTKWQWNSTLGMYWNPFPVYSRPSAHDGLLLNFKDDCPAFTKLRDSIGELPIAKQLQEEMQDFTANVARATGMGKFYNFFDTSTAIEDAIHYHQSHPNVNDSGALPSWLNDTLAADFRRIADMRMHLLVGANGDRQRTRFRTGNLLHDMFDRMSAFVQKTGDNFLKMVLYSGHDENVAAILAAFNLFNYTLHGPNFGIPDFTASIIMELHKNKTVRLLLRRNHTSTEPEILMHPQCPVPFCPFDKLYALISDVILTEKEWKEECGLASSKSRQASLQVPPPLPAGSVIGLPESIVIAGTLLAVAIISAAVIGLCIFVARKRKKSQVDMRKYGTTFEFLDANGQATRP